MTRSTATLRRLPLPVSEPPFDDELGRTPEVPAPGSGTQGTLALSFTLPSGVPATPPVPPALRLVPLPAPCSDDDGPRPTPRAQLCDPRPWAGRLVQATFEVLTGDRPVAQLLRWTSAEVYADLQRRVTVSARVCPPHLRDGVRAAVRSVRVCEPDDGVAEACALVVRRGRTTAVALRLEGLDGRWQCTALELG